MSSENVASKLVDAGRMPVLVAGLGAGGLIPFVACAVTLWFTPGAFGVSVGHVVIAYGAVILSFLGGAIWGFAASSMAVQHESPRSIALFPLSVIPSLIAWLCVFLPQPVALTVLAVAFLVVLLLDYRVLAMGLGPAWWMRLRVPLTAIVVISLLIAAWRVDLH